MPYTCSQGTYPLAPASHPVAAPFESPRRFDANGTLFHTDLPHESHETRLPRIYGLQEPSPPATQAESTDATRMKRRVVGTMTTGNLLSCRRICG